MLPQRVVVGVDGSAHPVATLRWASAHAVRTPARSDVVACWQWPTSPRTAAPDADLDLTTPTRNGLHAAVTTAVDVTAGSEGVEIRAQAIEGHPAHAPCPVPIVRGPR